MNAAEMIATTPNVAGEEHYFTEPLLLGLLAALIVLGSIIIGRYWLRKQHSSNPSECISTQIQEPTEVISPPSVSQSFCLPTPRPPPLQHHQIRTTPPPSKVLQSVMPSMKETHFCPHTRDPGFQVALHSAPSRPKPLTPPPSSTSTFVSQKTQTFNSARSITPVHPPTHAVHPIVAAAAAKTPMSEQRSEDVQELSDSAADMMALNKMTKDDAKRMRQNRASRSSLRTIRRPPPVSAEAITNATNPKDAILFPYDDDVKDNPKHLFSQEHAVDSTKKKLEAMPKSDVTQQDGSGETVEMECLPKNKKY